MLRRKGGHRKCAVRGREGTGEIGAGTEAGTERGFRRHDGDGMMSS